MRGAGSCRSGNAVTRAMGRYRWEQCSIVGTVESRDIQPRQRLDGFTRFNSQ